jgi:SpoIIAA-like
MIELLTGMPEGTIGLRVSGRLTREDFRGIVPPLRQAAEAGEVRIVEVIGPDYEGLEPGAVIEDLKVGLDFLVGHRSALKRTAIVTDFGWVRRAVQAFAWMVPGEVQIFDLDALDEATAWAAG